MWRHQTATAEHPVYTRQPVALKRLTGCTTGCIVYTTLNQTLSHSVGVICTARWRIPPITPHSLPSQFLVYALALFFTSALYKLLTYLPVLTRSLASKTTTRKFTHNSLSYSANILFHSRLKTFPFCKSIPPQPFLFFFGTDSTDSSDCLLLLLSISVVYFLVFLVLHFLVVGSVR